MLGTCFLPCISIQVSHTVLFRWYQAQSCHLLCRCFRCYEEHVPSSFRCTCFSTWTEVVVWALLRCLDRAFISDIHKPSVLSCCSIDIQSLLLDTCHFCHAIFHIGSSHVAIFLGIWWMADYETFHVCRVTWCQQCVKFWWWPGDPGTQFNFKKFLLTLFYGPGAR